MIVDHRPNEGLVSKLAEGEFPVSDCDDPVKNPEGWHFKEDFYIRREDMIRHILKLAVQNGYLPPEHAEKLAGHSNAMTLNYLDEKSDCERQKDRADKAEKLIDKISWDGAECAHLLSDRWFAGNQAEWGVYEVVDAVFPDSVNEIGCDHYDNSLEVYFYGKVEPEFRVTTEHIQKMEALGFSTFFFNYADGTLQIGGINRLKEIFSIGARLPSPTPRIQYADDNKMREAVRRAEKAEKILKDLVEEYWPAGQDEPSMIQHSPWAVCLEKWKAAKALS